MADSGDSAHWRAVELTSKLVHAPIVTTDEVLAEYLTLFATAHEQMRRKAVVNAQRILNNPGVRVIPQSHDSFLSGMALYEERPDKRYSLIDCISMQTMRREGLTDILTNDRHFEQKAFGHCSVIPKLFKNRARKDSNLYLRPRRLGGSRVRRGRCPPSRQVHSFASARWMLPSGRAEAHVPAHPDEA